MREWMSDQSYGQSKVTATLDSVAVCLAESAFSSTFCTENPFFTTLCADLIGFEPFFVLTYCTHRFVFIILLFL